MPITAPRNEFKRRLLADETLYGLWMMSVSPVLAEAASLLGYDWMLFDSEHSPAEISGLQPLMQAAAGGTSALLARPAWNDQVLIKRVLDIGAQTLVVPFVQSAEEAAAAVQWARYPPQGQRGVSAATRAGRYGLAADYFQVANDEICLLVQVETRAAIDRIGEIAAVDGVDGVFIGPSDLAASLGHIGNPGHEAVQAVLRSSVEPIVSAGKSPGILATGPETARRYADWGYRFIGVTTDLAVFTGGARKALADVSASRDL